MAGSSTRRDFLQKGTALVTSGLVVPPAIAGALLTPEGTGKGEGSPSKRTPIAKPETKIPPTSTGSAEELKRFTEEQGGEVPKWLAWWRTNLLRVDFDMLMTDASPEALSKIDPEDMAATIADAGLQALWGYVQDPTGWVYYPSIVAQQHPALKGRDLVGEYVAACCRHGLKFMGYYAPYENGVQATRHPEWRNEFPGDRVPSSPRLWGRLCFNRPGCFDFYLSLLRESVTRYEIDAVWFDGVWVDSCACPYCQKRYKKETGRELPFYFNQPLMTLAGYPDRPEHGHYFYQIQKWLNRWTMELRGTVKDVRPDCVVVFQDVGYAGHGPVGYTADITEAADVTTRDAEGYANQLQHSLEFKSVRGFSRNFPFDAETNIGEHHSDEVSPKEEGLLKQTFAYILAHGGGVSYIDDMDWQGRISKKKYQRMKGVNAWCRERFPYLGGVMVADVGLYLSHESNIYRPKWHHYRWRSTRGDAERGIGASIHRAGNVAFVRAMIRENIPFDVLHRNKLRDIGRHKVMYMNNVEVLREEEAGALREFVKRGGGLIVTHRTGLRDEQYQEQSNFLLADLIGADYLETPDIATSFVMVGPEDRAEGFFVNVISAMPYFEVHCPQSYVKPREGGVRLGKVARPRRPYMEDGGPAPGKPPVMQLIDPKEIRQANAGYLYAPEIITDHPAIVLNRYGKGRVAYCAAYPSYDYIDDIHDLIIALVNWAAGGKLDATVTSNAPGPVEIITMEQLKENRTVVHAINWQPSWPGVVASNVQVGIKTFGRRPKRAFAVEAKRRVPVETSESRLSIEFPPIEAWEVVAIEWG